MNFDELLEANEELLMERIKDLKVTQAGADEEILKSYGVIFDKHIALLKLEEEANKLDVNESIEQAKREHEKEILEIKLKAEKEIAELKVNNDREIAERRAETDKEVNTKRCDVDIKRLAEEAEANKRKYELEDRKAAEDKKSNWLNFIKDCAGVVAMIAAPIVTEMIKQSVHERVCDKVLIFEETGSIGSTVGKAEFRK